MAGKFELSRSANRQYYFNLKAGNGEIILSSEQYEAKASALNGIESVRKNGVIEERFARQTSTKGEPFFVLKAGNGEVIGRSEMYSSAAAMENGIAAVKKNAPASELRDLSKD